MKLFTSDAARIWTMRVVAVALPGGIASLAAAEPPRIAARKPQVIGPRDRPHRCILQDGDCYLGWSNNEFYEPGDGVTLRFRLDKADLYGIEFE
jgi:hypothetical protein